MISSRNPKAITVVATLAAVCAGYGRQLTSLSAAQNAGKTVASNVYSAEQAKRGQTKYMMVCSGCHQADLSGSDQAPSLAGGDFLDRWDGQTVTDLADRIRTSMPADDVGSLTTEMSVYIVAYLLQANNFPAGSDEMKPDRAALRSITIKKK